MNKSISENKSSPIIKIEPIQTSKFNVWMSKQPRNIKNWLKSTAFQAEPLTRALIPGNDGKLRFVAFGINKDPSLWDWAHLPNGLPYGSYKLNETDEKKYINNVGLAWSLENYRFMRYRQPKCKLPHLIKPSYFNESAAKATYLVRDLINTPANNMGPSDLAKKAMEIATNLGASCTIIAGDDLIKQGYPSIHMVGQANNRNPCLIDMRWGNQNAPKLTLIGKGVCFDTGGLNIKSSANMGLMKKDMGGAAHALGLTQMIISENLDIKLRLLIPAVENSISSNSMRPGDVVTSRSGISIEIGNTDAEGRVILADTITEACSENPEMIIDFATLTGAARIALGSALPALFCNDNELAESILLAGKETNDPLWRLPLWRDYNSQISGKIADLTNSPSSPLGGAITAALFLEKFVEPHIPWAHIDLMAWNSSSSPGRPEGGEAMSMRAVFAAIKKKYK